MRSKRYSEDSNGGQGMAKVVITRDDDGSGDWLAEGDIGDCAYFANAESLEELKSMIHEAADLAGADAHIVISPDVVTDTVTA